MFLNLQHWSERWDSERSNRFLGDADLGTYNRGHRPILIYSSVGGLIQNGAVTESNFLQMLGILLTLTIFIPP
ncbi:uncharacterized protein H6S33_010201 [Morchella sextelata]|uniref:uncharacterized protein n=1 Tax=Morchella sextelata TaxID=1174677 RepID=UPI001D040E9B|nr:uncharacterized protein H6S33_010201 [Morchella sextelata]KAH0612149.1 hypothetical protein H6S33_010201 [Morchella sextelata]